MAKGRKIPRRNVVTRVTARKEPKYLYNQEPPPEAMADISRMPQKLDLRVDRDAVNPIGSNGFQNLRPSPQDLNDLRALANQRRPAVQPSAQERLPQKDWFQLPQRKDVEEPSYYNYGTPTDGRAQWGRQRTMRVIDAIGSRISAGDTYIPFQVGNIALRGGGYFKDHDFPGDHGGPNAGIGFDFRPVKKNGALGPTNWKSPDYDRHLTQQLVDHVLAVGPVKTIYFNDPYIRGVRPWKGHDNHLHAHVDPEGEE